MLYKPEVSGQLAAWAMELGQYVLEYHPRTAIKGQTLADFVAECSFSEPNSSDQPDVGVGSVTNVLLAQSS